MKLIDNINDLLGDDIKQSVQPGARLKIAASTFSIYAFEALKRELESVESFEFIFTSPSFIPDEVTDAAKKERREFHIPKSDTERSFYGTEFEVQLKNKLTQRAIARECADWMRRKAKFRSNSGAAPMQQFAAVQAGVSATVPNAVYMPLHGFTAVDLGYQRGNAVSNIVNKFDEPANTNVFLSLFDQIWADPDKLKDVTSVVCEHIASVYQENSPERIYFLMLYNIFSEFLEDLTEDVLPNDRTGYLDTLVWQKLFNFQRDAATGIINKLETFNGCILADSVGLGKTFTALAVIKYYELRNRSVLVLCPKKLADNWLTYNRNLKTNIFAKDRFNYDVLCHTDLQRTRGDSFGMPLNRVNWGNYDLVVIDESHNFRNNDAYKDKETRYQKLMNSVIKQGVKTKVLMLSATPVNNRFNDLRNQLALAYEGNTGLLGDKLRTEKDIDEIFRRAQAAFNNWTKLPPIERTASTILAALDFDFFELLDSVTIARSRKHIKTFYDTKDIGNFPERLKPQSFHCPLTLRTDVIGFNDIFNQLSLLKLAVYAPVSYILPSRVKKYEDMYDKLWDKSAQRRFTSVFMTKKLKAQTVQSSSGGGDLSALVQALSVTHQQLQAQAARSVDTALVVRNWFFGWHIMEFEQGAAARAQVYGKQLLVRRSVELVRRGLKGVSVTNLKQCRTFYQTYPEIGQTPSDQSPMPPNTQKLAERLNLGWSQYVVLLSVSNAQARSFYAIEAQQGSWGVRELKRQVDSGLFERLALSRSKDEVRALAQVGQLVAKPTDVIKNPYVLEFLDLPEHPAYSEHQLEMAIIDKLEHFLLELGKGFLFEARQKRFTFDDNHFYVDLVFYNRLLRCYVVIDLKIGSLTHQDLGQMQMYVNYFDRHVKTADEAPTVGILLCYDKNDALVELTLPENSNIYAAQYQLYLPSKEELRQKIQEAEAAWEAGVILQDTMNAEKK